MEVLGFYDEPYQVAVEPPRLPPRVAAIVTSTHPPARASDPSSRVSALWESTQIEDSALDWWKPHVVARRKLGGRRVRLSAILALLFALAGLVFLASSMLQRSERVAEQWRETLGADTRAFLQTLVPVEEAVNRISQTEPPDLTESTERMLQAETAARRLFADAGSLSDHRREAAMAAAGGALEATSRANQLLAYRMAAERVLAVPVLPVDPGETGLAPATEAVAGWRAEIETEVAELPDVLPAHRAEMETWLESLDGWQSGYLDALRQEDGAAMAASLGELEDGIQSLHRILLDELAEAGGELRAEIGDSRRAAERLLAD